MTISFTDLFSDTTKSRHYDYTASKLRNILHTDNYSNKVNNSYYRIYYRHIFKKLIGNPQEVYHRIIKLYTYTTEHNMTKLGENHTIINKFILGQICLFCTIILHSKILNVNIILK